MISIKVSEYIDLGHYVVKCLCILTYWSIRIRFYYNLENLFITFKILLVELLDLFYCFSDWFILPVIVLKTILYRRLGISWFDSIMLSFALIPSAFLTVEMFAIVIYVLSYLCDLLGL